MYNGKQENTYVFLHRRAALFLAEGRTRRMVLPDDLTKEEVSVSWQSWI